jgi:hypothetical protein
MSEFRRSFVLDMEFIDRFNTQLVIPLNYRAIANFQTLNKSLAHTLSPFQLAGSSLDVSW